MQHEIQNIKVGLNYTRIFLIRKKQLPDGWWIVETDSADLGLGHIHGQWTANTGFHEQVSLTQVKSFILLVEIHNAYQHVKGSGNKAHYKEPL